LNEAWEAAGPALREAILLAARGMDEQLSAEPNEQGESREGRTRVLFRAPVGVLFEVDEEKKLVQILRAWVYRAGVPGA
jgi:hypothetical protein